MKVTLSWLHEHLRETVEVLGEGFCQHGLDPDRHVLETFARHSHQQGLARRLLAPEEIVLAGASDRSRV